jgi:DNA primase small subunit
MGLEMDQTSSQEGSADDRQDIDLPDAPPAETEQPDKKNTSIALEQLFDQDDSDDEFPTPTSDDSNIPSSPPVQSAPTSSDVQPAAQSESYSDPNLMLQFYSRLFPFRQLFYWLNHSPKPGPDFGNREFALTLSNDAYLRYQSYATADLLRKDILRLNPSRFEIGPVYTTNPRDRKTLRKSSMFKPLSKEIVFDIDLTDYDDIRSCCTKANICAKCWTFATMAIKVVDAALRDDFGFEHIMWVYSGRRGVHAWISDKDARELDDDKRKAITGYFEVLKGGAQGGKRVNLKRPLHPHLTRSLDILKPYFQNNILVDQEPFLSEAGQARLLQLLPDQGLKDALKKKWDSSPDRPSARKWADIDSVAAAGASDTLDTRALMEAKQDILLEYTYPRLDVEVGKKRIHLLKSPFVVHPGTGRVCVPITTDGDMDQVDKFDPLTVPKVTELLKEVDTFQSANGETKPEDDGYVEDGATMRKVNDWEKTRLKPYVEMFETYVKTIMKSESVRVKRERDDEGITGADGMEF